MTALISLLATIALTAHALWLLGSCALRILGSLLILAALAALALGDWPFASADARARPSPPGSHSQSVNTSPGSKPCRTTRRQNSSPPDSSSWP
jgi:hypothetical protein